jgi:ABC-type glycerol-3-phosphate transport system permease component
VSTPDEKEGQRLSSPSPLEAPRPRARRRRAGSRLSIGMVVMYAVLTSVTIAWMTPLIWMVSSSFKSGEEIFRPPRALTEARKRGPGARANVARLIGDVMLPEEPTTENYRRLFTELPFPRFFVNSIFVATAQTLLTLLFCSLGGYAFAKYVFPGRGALFTVVLGSMMIPFHVLLVPLFSLMGVFHWFDTFRAIIIPFSASAFGIFLMRQYTLSVPDDLLDAARIDGCSEFRIYWNVVLPCVRPALGALTIFVFMNSWNNFLWPLIILRSDTKYTLPLGLANLVGVYSQEYGMLMAGTLLSTLPIIILFLFMQREFVSGITLGAVKE